MNKEILRGLIDNNLLLFYIVSLISADNEPTKEQWTKNKKRLLEIKQCIEEIECENKEELIEQIDKCIDIANKELEAYD